MFYSLKNRIELREIFGRLLLLLGGVFFFGNTYTVNVKIAFCEVANTALCSL